MVVLSAAETNADDDAATVWSAVHRAAAANWESAPATRVGVDGTVHLVGIWSKTVRARGLLVR